MNPMSLRLRAFLPAAIISLVSTAALAQTCQKEGSFEAWLGGVRAEASAMGLSQGAIDSALGSVRFDQAIVNKDRAQGVFTQDFLQFSDRMVETYRIPQGVSAMKKSANTFAQIEQTFGVPAPVLAAFWGLETDFGAFVGDGPTLVSLATLAYDCRRPELFRRQLLAAIAVIDRGDLSAGEMRGPWAGEVGQVQFLMEHYLNYGVDLDGDGRVNMLKSSADALGSAANYLRSIGWRAGEPWLEEVRVPAEMPWEQADITNKLPLSQWAQWGVTRADGSPLQTNGPNAALHLPMGRNGPAFLAYPNFDLFIEWNNSLVYSTTAAYFATRLAGAPKVHRGSGTDLLDAAGVKEIQKLLQARGYDVGKIDGIIGLQTRAAVKDAQLRLGLPADSYPDRALLARLRAGA
jgi:lytic murein transglycosylase